MKEVGKKVHEASGWGELLNKGKEPAKGVIGPQNSGTGAAI